MSFPWKSYPRTRLRFCAPPAAIIVALASLAFPAQVKAQAATGPTALTATGNDLYVSLSWQPVTGATQYRVYRSSSASTLPSLSPAILYVQDVSATDPNVTAGQTYTYQVTAVTPAGETAPSNPASATPQINLAPVVKMTAPSDGITITAGTSLTVSASASARTGSISRIDFYADRKGFASMLMGTVTTSPYSLILSTLPVDSSGNLRVKAVATDTGGNTATSAPINISVDATGVGVETESLFTPMSPTQAIATARSFCQTIGAPVPDGTPTRAIYKSPGAGSSYWLPVWKVGFLGVASVEVANASSLGGASVPENNSGIVTSYLNTALSNQLSSSNQPTGTPITQAAALTVAATVLQASKQPANELVSQQATQSQLTSPATHAGDLWTVQWARAASGVPYRNDSASLLLQAETGAVEAWNLSFTASPPSGQTTQAVTRVQSQQIAQAAMDSQGNSLGLSGQTFQAAGLAVVQPDTLWQTQGGGTTRPIPGIPSSIAWDCVFTNATDPNNPSGMVIAEVWVDSNTGQVVGGDILRMMGRRKPAPAVRPLVPKAKAHS